MADLTNKVVIPATFLIPICIIVKEQLERSEAVAFAIFEPIVEDSSYEVKSKKKLFYDVCFSLIPSM